MSAMDYRDERDAMRGRIENLEQDLASANQELEERRHHQDPQRIAELEKQLADARRQLDLVGSELERVKGGRAPKPTGVVVVAALAGVVVAMGALGFLLLRGSAAPPPVSVEPPAPPEVQEAPRPTPPKAAPAVPTRRVRAQWKGSVTRATGLALAPGTACTIDATLEGRERGVAAKDLTVTCGGTPLYRSTDALEGMSMYSSDASEEPGPNASTHVYALAYHDKGTRTGARSEVSLDTSAKTGAVWRDSAPAWRVELAITPKSAAVQGEALAHERL
jgi:hypothetical protein